MKTLIGGLLLAGLIGCSGEAKKPDANTGPRITSGKVDDSARPEKPSLGGKMESGK